MLLRKAILMNKSIIEFFESIEDDLGNASDFEVPIQQQTFSTKNEAIEDDDFDVSMFPEPAQRTYTILYASTGEDRFKRKVRVLAREPFILNVLEAAGALVTITPIGEKITDEHRKEFKKDVLDLYEEYDEDSIRSYLLDMAFDMEYSLKITDTTSGEVIFDVASDI